MTSPSPPPPLSGTVLLVEDDQGFQRVCRRVLERAGLSVDAVASPQEALSLARARRYDAVVSDIRLPGGDGVALLRDVRALDATVPFVLMTGAPTLQTAVDAVEHGALRYLQKPFDLDRLLAVVGEAIGKRAGAGDLASLNRRLDRALEAAWMAYQPIMRWSARGIEAYEALLRCEAPEVRGPLDLLELAERTHRLPELGRLVRRKVAADAPALAPNVLLFVNLHPSDLDDEELYSPTAPLSAFAPKVVLEITERASVVHREALPRDTARLRALGFRVAVDDLGAGYSGLTTFARVKPEFVKLDASLVRNIDASPTQRLVVSTVLSLARELDIELVAEAIESPAERQALTALGVEHLQGYWFARPARPFVGLQSAALAESVAA